MTHRQALTVAIASLFIMLFAAHSSSATPGMQVIGKASPPIGHYEFCRIYTSECQPAAYDPGPMSLTEDRWRAVLDVNYTVNTSIVPMTDQEIYGVEERWAYPRTVGDCEDFVLLKRKMLMARGFDPADLLITVVLQPNGEGHAVLTVRTDHGDFVLDNMRNKVLLWSETEYTFLKRQAADHPGQWVKLQDGRTIAVGSVGQ
ncbi:MAG: transglutaminase-like cysteine peptidase [Pseudorhizobium sp.]